MDQYPEPTVIPRSEHNISRQQISENALRVMYRLVNHGFQAYMVGGGVRDLMLGREPKDFDVVTDATPEEVKGLFRNGRIIGRRFRLVHVQFGREIIEVSTFRAAANEEQTNADGQLLRDNEFGSIEEDAWRRDFTLNSLYYNIADFSVIDFTNGLADLDAGVIRLIGDPEKRYREDPVRMLRAVRFAAKLGITICPESARPIESLGGLIENVPAARLFDEVLKLFQSGHGAASYERMQQFGLLKYLFPQTAVELESPDISMGHDVLLKALENTDNRLAEGKSVTPAFLYAAFLWGPVARLAEELIASQNLHPRVALQKAGQRVINEQNQSTFIPRRFSVPMREIWQMQPDFKTMRGRKPMRLMVHPRFRAAYDFMLLRAHAGQVPQETADWWTQIQTDDPHAREKRCMGGAAGKPRRRRKPKPKPADS